MHTVVVDRQPDHAAGLVVQGDGHGVGLALVGDEGLLADRQPPAPGRGHQRQTGLERPNVELQGRSFLKHPEAGAQHDFAVRGDFRQSHHLAPLGGVAQHEPIFLARFGNDAELPHAAVAGCHIDDALALAVDDRPADVNRGAERIAGRQIDAVLQISHQFAALGKKAHVDRASLEGDPLGDRFAQAAVVDHHDQLPVAPLELRGQRKLDLERAVRG